LANDEGIACTAVAVERTTSTQGDYSLLNYRRHHIGSLARTHDGNRAQLNR